MPSTTASTTESARVVNVKEVVKTMAGVRLIPAPHNVARERKDAATGYELRVAVRAPYMIFFFQMA